MQLPTSSRFLLDSVSAAAEMMDSRSDSVKRRKVGKACDRCRSRKRKCDGQQPCSLCATTQTSCRYDLPNRRSRQSEPPAGHATQDIFLVDQDAQPSISQSEANAHNVSRCSRAVSPFAEDEAQLGQYFGPTSTFSVSITPPFRPSSRLHSPTFQVFASRFPPLRPSCRAIAVAVLPRRLSVPVRL